MKYIFLFFLLAPVLLHAQLENVIVETYYVSDANDATDTMGGTLPVGSKTYRVYIDLLPGFKLKKIYGDTYHAFRVTSTAPFFNNKEDGQTYAKDFSKNRYGDNTVALDTWLTLGQVTKPAATTYYGIPKNKDTDGSFVGGTNNDGGSAMIPGGLLVNNDAAAGTPLITQDGISPMTVNPANWGSFGITDLITGDDSTIFGSIVAGTEFFSRNMALQNSGVGGVIPEDNQILVAQFTTTGELSFEFNIEVLDSVGNSIKYVANADTLLTGEVGYPNLKYPPACGCMNANYLEYSVNFACNAIDSCKTLIVFGCMDPAACNYNAGANFSIPTLCCYPGSCNDLDISLVCPTVGIEDEKEPVIKLYPNPADATLNFQVEGLQNKDAAYAVYDLLGRKILEGGVSQSSITGIDVSPLSSGVYMLRLIAGGASYTQRFTKN